VFDAIDKEKNNGKIIIAIELATNSKNHTELANIKQPMCLILGNELTGIDNDILEKCDQAIQIPMFGVKHSLNVSVTAGIVLYEAIKGFQNL
jgi:tRNA G18 (ribose-2'-O)-methylase SpoU